jgi:predicted nucleic acid-binding protein
MPVVDASAVVELVARTARGVAVRRVIQDGVIAPELLDVEVLSALARQERAGSLTHRQASDAVARFNTLAVDRISHSVLARSVWQLRHRVRVSDAFYVACARLLATPLVTTDARLFRAPLPGVTVTLVS